MLTFDKFFIGGEWVAPAGNETLKVLSATTEEVIGSVPVATPADMDRAVAAAKAAFAGPWRDWTPEQRAELLTRIADGIKSRQDELTGLITNEVGAPYFFSMFGQVLSAAMVFDSFAAGRDGAGLLVMSNGWTGTAHFTVQDELSTIPLSAFEAVDVLSLAADPSTGWAIRSSSAV